MSGAIITGVLFAVAVGLAIADPNPVCVGCAVLCGCMFLVNLARSTK